MEQTNREGDFLLKAKKKPMKERQYLITERTFFMCPNMHFGIKAKIIGDYKLSKVKQSLNLLADAHPFLKSKIAQEEKTKRLFYKSDFKFQIPIIEKENSNLWFKDYQSITACGWNVFEESLLKIILYPEENSFNILFIANHLLGDGRSILQLMCEFADCYISGEKPVYVEEQLIRSILDLPKGSDLPLISRAIIHKINRNWLRERREVKYEKYLAFEKEFIRNNKIAYELESLDTEKLNELKKLCRTENISINDYLVAEMMNKEKIDPVVIAADIRDQLTCYRQGALGNYATAFIVKNKLKTNDILEKAKSVSKQIKQSLNNVQKKMTILACYFRLYPELIDAAAISTMGKFPSKAGKRIGTLILGYGERQGYSITNLGKINHSNIEEAIFIPPASPAVKKIMGVLTTNSRMTKCTLSYE